MGINIYVGDLSYQATEEEVRQAFESYGPVTSVAIIKDKFSGQSKGFGFVEMSDAEQGKAAISGLDGSEFKGRRLRVNEARPRPEGGGGGGGGRDRGGPPRRSGGGGGGGGERRGGGGGGGGRDRW